MGCVLRRVRCRDSARVPLGRGSSCFDTWSSLGALTVRRDLKPLGVSGDLLAVDSHVFDDDVDDAIEDHSLLAPSRLSLWQAAAMSKREQGLLAWQWGLYPEGHQDRRNLLLHIFSVPIFMLGCLALVGALVQPWLAVGGAVAMLTALVLEGRGHRLETVRPLPFESAFDFVSRFFVEQWITFPRYVASGGFALAWRNATARARPSP
jgi:hypothetical protein